MTTYRPTHQALAICIALLASGLQARAQTATSGEIRGRVFDAETGEALAGVTIVATSPSLQGSRSVISAGDGRYALSDLPPGTYLVAFYFADVQVNRDGVTVPLGQVTYVNQKIQPGGETITIRRQGSTIDPTSTNQGTRITQEQMQNIPVPGRTFSSALGQAAGSQGDSQGVAFSGSTSLENQFVIDGVNTTSLTYGTIGTPLINEFIEEIQVLTGGYQAEYGRATGAVVNVLTKSGSNEFHGSAFATITPYQVNRTPVREVKTSIDGTVDLDYLADFGFDLGGPIIKDKLWFYVGFAPQLARSNVSRVVQRQTDCRETMADGSLSPCQPEDFANGSPDVDPLTGDIIFEEVEKREFKTSSQAYQFAAKINGAVTAEHQGQLTLLGTPLTGQGMFGVAGSDRAIRADFQGVTTDLSGKWTSKFNDNKTEVEAVAGWHRDKYDQDALDDSVLDTPTTRVFLSNLSRFGAYGQESMDVRAGCTDSLAQGDPYPSIENCPVFQYWLDSPGFTIDNLEDRRSGRLHVTQRIKAIGSHVAKAGIDLEDNRVVDVRHLTGGRFFQLIPDPSFDQVRVYRYVKPSVDSAPDLCFDVNGDAQPCTYLDEAEVTGRTVNWSAFLQDSWQVLPNLTLNAGVRYEEQRLRYAEEIQNTVDPFTDENVGVNALKLTGMVAPRLGILYDWTREGRSKVYASYGRFYESIPMALNDFSFSGTTLYGAFFGSAQCRDGNEPSQDSTGSAPSPYNCPEELEEMNAPSEGNVYRGGTTLVTPSTKAQFLDERVLGVEYEVLEDLTVALAYKDRRLGRVLEDMSPDGGVTYVIGNPGQFDSDEEARLQAELDSLADDDPDKALLEGRLEAFKQARTFDKPRREYKALELTATKRVSKNFYVQGSYTYARTRGNYPGLLNEDNGSGAALPNISTQYDLPELLANRQGPLPQDRPHYLKLDGYYVFDFKRGGELTTGVRFRALSGTPVDALGSHYLYGFGESYVLPRGSQGRTEFVTGTDLHVAYARKLAKGYKLSAFADIINFFNQEQVAVVDELYTLDNVNPIVGGSPEDFVFAKQVDNDGTDLPNPAGRNVAFGTPLGRYTPLYIRIGARLSF